MKTEHFFSLDRPSLTGLFLMAVPFSFWIAVLFEQVFDNPFLFNSIFVAIDNASPLLTVLLLVVLPLIALAWNLLNIIKVQCKMHEGDIVTTLTVRTHLISIGVIGFAALNIFFIGCYVFFENFNVSFR